MKKLFFLAFLFTIANAYGQEPPINVIPQPVEILQLPGSYLLTKATTIGFDSQPGQKIAEMLAEKLTIPTGFSIKAQQGKGGTIQFNLNKVLVTQLGKEGYILESSAKGVVITANEAAGLFYGMQTLLQLLPEEIESKSLANIKWTIPSVKIKDYPRFGWRGLMLDVSRHFFTKEDVKLYIDQISRYKFNTFHWHLTDDHGWRIEIKSLPRLTEVGAWRVPRSGQFSQRAEPKPGEATTEGGFYSQNDIKEIIQFAKERNVTIVPEIDVPGHSMAAIASYPELSCSKNPDAKVNPGASFAKRQDNVLNPSDEKVYEFLDKVFTEIAALFPNPYIHAGGDEVNKGFWMADTNCVALMKKMKMTRPEELQAYFMKRVEGILNAKGKKLIGWDEILEGGISHEATVMSWRGIKGGIEAAKTGHDVVMTPTTFAYLDYQQGESTIEPRVYASLRLNKCYSFEPVPEGIDAKYILGGQGNLWTEQVATLRHAEYMTWPRGWALAEDFWSPKESKNWTNFVQRVEKHFGRADKAEIRYSPAIYDAVVNLKTQDEKMILDMDSEAPGLDIYYSTDGSMPDNFSTKYTNPVEIPEGPVTLRIITYRNGKPAGHLITLRPEDFKKRQTK